MSDDDTAAREAFKAWVRDRWSNFMWRYKYQQRQAETEANFVAGYLAASRSIPAAAALLREAGWTVVMPGCCGGACPGCRGVQRPTCNGTRKRS